jgi:hypothetical protein
MKKLLTTFLIMVPVLLAACASTPDDSTEIPLDSDPRIGEEVNQVCFARNLDSWQNVDNDGRAVILKMNNRETFKATLSGVCEPDWATVGIAVITRPGSNCISRGDRLKTDGDTARGYGSACTISHIYKWNPDAVSQPEQ